MIRNIVGSLGVLASCAFFAACDAPSDKSDITQLFEQSRSSKARDQSPSISKEKLATLRRGNVDLSFRLLEQVAKDEQNAAISGVSLQSSLGMAHAMASGDTQKNIEESAGFLPSAKETYAGLNYFSQELASREEPERDVWVATELTQVNEVFFRQDMRPGSDFLDLLAKNFGVGVSMVDFSKDAPAILDKINTWIAGQTKNTIPSFLSSSDVQKESQWLLLNALYLQVAWPVDFQAPKEHPFTTAKGEKIKHPTFEDDSMEGRSGKDEDARWAYLPTRSDDLTLLVILPEKGDVSDLIAKLDGERLEKMAKSSKERVYRLKLPQFSVDSGRMDLSKAFKALGMKAPFKEGANFRGYSDGKENTTPLARIVQQVVVSADRRGISAGAATTFDGQKAGVGDQDYSMILDRPFVFAVMDEPTGLALFVGQVVDPRG